MRPHRLRSPGRISLSWLLWLALLLPVAQTAANWHAYAHSAAEGGVRSSSGGKQLPRVAHCDLCLTVLALGAAGPVGTPRALTPFSAAHERPIAVRLGVWLAPTSLPFRSRAPPLLPR